jgi:hypothetical protein
MEGRILKASSTCLFVPSWEEKTCLITPFSSITIGHPAWKQTKSVGNIIQPPDLASLVAEQGEREAVLFRKAPVRLHRVRANPYNLGIELFELLVIVPEGAGFLGTLRGVVFGIEEQDHGLSIQKIFEVHHLP